MPTKSKHRSKCKGRSNKGRRRWRSYPYYLKTKGRLSTKNKTRRPRQHAGSGFGLPYQSTNNIVDILQKKDIAFHIRQYLDSMDQKNVREITYDANQLINLNPNDSIKYFWNEPIQIKGAMITFRQKLFRENNSAIHDAKNQLCLFIEDQVIRSKETNPFNISDCLSISFQNCKLTSYRGDRIHNVQRVIFISCEVITHNRFLFENIQQLFFMVCNIDLGYTAYLRSIPHLDFTGSTFMFDSENRFFGNIPSEEVLEALPSYINLSHTNIISVKGLEYTKELDLSHTSIIEISTLTHVKKLNITGCAFITPQEIDTLKQNNVVDIEIITHADDMFASFVPL